MIYAYIHIYTHICARIYARAREPPTFPESAFPEMDRGRILLLWIGVAGVFPENGWTGVGLRVVAGHFQKGRWTGVGGPAVFPFPSGLIVINGHKKAPGVITWGYCDHTRESRIFRPFMLTCLTAITSSVLVSTVIRWSPL